VVQRLSHLRTHQGVVVMARQPGFQLRDLVRGTQGKAPLLVLAAGVQDPGNLGALIRCAEAAGASGLLALAGGANPYRDKAVRGSMGSVFRLPCVAEVILETALEFLEDNRLLVVVADQSAPAGSSRPFWEADLTGPTALVLGSEGSGVPAALRRIAKARVRIPIARPVDSLNVAVAAGVLLFEARRQRR
jgi:TrmH family RNA methyltransferase